MDQQHHVGLNVSVKEIAICIVDPHGKFVQRADVECHPSVISRHMYNRGHSFMGVLCAKAACDWIRRDKLQNSWLKDDVR